MTKPGKLTKLSRSLRKNQTDAERVLWRRLRQRQLAGCKFRRQQPLGRYIVDFACLERKLVVEVDGGQHLERSTKDALRDQWLGKQGFAVLRFWDNEVINETGNVLETILSALQARRRESERHVNQQETETPRQQAANKPRTGRQERG